MIKILDKKDCNGCRACADICCKNAISFKVDNEGFWYPEVDMKLCNSCGLCTKTCPEINENIANAVNTIDPECYGAHHKEQDIRLESTSGGVFSALANKFYDMGGYVAGAIYNEDFSVSHFVSNNREDLQKLRSSKYLQSNCEGLYKDVKKLLLNGEKVLVCGCPCQMAALRLFLNKEYEYLVICDFICLGINSPKVFRKHLDSLELKYDSKVVYAKAKNKEFGWRNLTFKAMFDNGKSYYGDGNVDDFTRGFLRTGVYTRPACYDCKFKKIPRIADLTLADFWGIEKVNPALDNDTGTSVVMCNSPKGIKLFDDIKPIIAYSQVNIEDIAAGNKSLFESMKESSINRYRFFEDLNSMQFNAVAKKYFPKKNIIIRISKIKKKIKTIIYPFYIMGVKPILWWQFIKINFLRKNTESNFFKGHVIIPTKCNVFDINKSAKILINGSVIFGYSKIKGSKLETRIRLEENSSLNIYNSFTFFAGADIQVFKNGELELKGGVGAGCNINCQIICASKITVGKSTLIGRNVVIRDYDGHFIIKKGYKVKSPIFIGDHCWIGDSAVISKGVKIGDGSIVATRSWVINRVKPKTLVGGSPAMTIEENIEWKF